MIILILKGGLGNQLFQYAAGRALSLRNGEELKFDITGYARTKNSDTPRDYLLRHFNIKGEKIATDEEIRRFKYPYGKVSKGWRMVRAKLGLYNVGWVPRIIRKKGDIFLDGYWQTEKYFKDFERDIRRELTLKDPLGPAAEAYAKLLRVPHPGIANVSLHVRRGDVARDAATNPYFGITTPEYYARALKNMERRCTERGQKMHIFVFSDGMDWVKENIIIPYPTTFVSAAPNNGNPIKDYEELALMSMCDTHIIANSTFSWWGAWLNPKPDKIVVAPQQWIKKYALKHKDIIPSSWIRI